MFLSYLRRALRWTWVAYAVCGLVALAALWSMCTSTPTVVGDCSFRWDVVLFFSPGIVGLYLTALMRHLIKMLILHEIALQQKEAPSVH